jgi:glycosyltransferase involved in cell wall biosynthesis
MNIAFVNTSFQLGGAETVAHALIDGCAAAGHATRLYVAAGKTYPNGDGVVPLYPRVLSRLHHSRFHAITERWAPRHEWTDRRFGRLASGWADVVHLHNFHGDYASVASLAKVARHKPLVWTFHGHWGITGGCDHPIECTRYRDACGNCPRLGVWPLGTVDDTAAQLELKARVLGGLPIHVVSPSRFIADRIARSRVGRQWQIHHIPNGVSTSEFRGLRKSDSALRGELGLDPTATTILVVNRNFKDPQKGFTLVREALAVIARDHQSVQVVLGGDNSAWAASQLPPALRAVSLGYVRSRRTMAGLFEVADIFLFASPAETFPCVVLEAMASECCVVATPTSGVTEQIDDRRTGLLATELAGEALGCTLMAALQDAGRRRALGRAAREHVIAHFSTESFVARHLDLYETMASGWVAGGDLARTNADGHLTAAR